MKWRAIFSNWMSKIKDLLNALDEADKRWIINKSDERIKQLEEKLEDCVRRECDYRLFSSKYPERSCSFAMNQLVQEVSWAKEDIEDHKRYIERLKKEVGQ
jgi:hypothetical protein